MPNTSELMRVSGATFRQVDHWVRRGWLREDDTIPLGQGHPRQFPAVEMQVACIMVRLIKAGLTVEAAHTVARGQSQLAPGVLVLVGQEVPVNG